MTKQFFFCALLPGLAVSALAAAAQTPTVSTYTQGDETIKSNKVRYTPVSILFSSGVTVTAPDYDMTALTAEVFLSPAKSPAPQSGSGGDFQKIVAEADLAHHTQIVGHFRQAPAQPPDGVGQGSTGVDRGRSYTVYADHAVYVRDYSRPQGGTLDLIGHPKIIGLAPDSLQGPSTTTFDDPAAVVHVLLGRAPDYPQVEGPANQTVLVPLH